MPTLGGFDVIRRLPSSGKDSHWLLSSRRSISTRFRRFETGAIDYLLKPVGQDRLAQAVDPRDQALHSPRCVRPEQLATMQEVAELSQDRPARRIVARSGEEYLLLNAEEVLAFQAEGELVWIVTAKKRYLATQSLKAVQLKLQNTSFRRIHRKALVNIDHVRKMSTLSSQRWLVTLSNGQEFIVSKRQAQSVRQLLSW